MTRAGGQRAAVVRARRGGRRGVVLLLVVVVVAIAALTGAALAVSASTERAGVSAARAATESRLAAWSGVQAVMSELAEQREALLVGEAPAVRERWTLRTRSDGTRLEVRLVPIEGGAAEAGVEVLVPESARLDVNAASATMLEELGLDAALAGRIVEARRRGAFSSVNDLLGVEGVTAEMLGFEGPWVGGGAEGPTAGGGELSADGAGAMPMELASLLTVFAFDPNLQGGIAEDGEAFRGRLRVNLDQPWSDRLARALTERFGEDAATGVERIMREGTTFVTDADIIKTLRRLNLPPETWGEILDVFTTTDDEYLLGRVDLRTADEAVLAALPGIDAEQAREIVAARERLSAESMLTSAWLVTEGILTPDDFEKAVDHVTTRCLQWRVRVEAGLARGGGDAGGVGGPIGGAFEGGSGEDVPLMARVVLEAVIDVSSQRPRIAYLRDVTLEGAAMSMLDDPTLGEALGVMEGGAELPDEDAWEEEASESGAFGAEGRDSADPGVDREGAGGGDVFGGDPDLGTSRRPGGESGEAGGEGAGARSGGEVSPGGEEESEFRDRRIGRWTSGGATMRDRAQGGAP